MITPFMTDEELRAAAYQDFLEIKMKVNIALEQFGHNLRLNSGQHRMIHSLMETKTIRTKARNTWNLCFMNDSYCLTGNGRFFINCFIYLPLHRGENVDFIFMTVMPGFSLHRLSSHFLQRYKERYLECNRVNLLGMHPALYYMYKNGSQTEVYYRPENWTEEDLKKKTILISEQGMSVVKVVDKILVYITFLDQENLSRYKAQVYEEESFWKDYRKFAEANKDAKLWQALYKKMYADPDKAKKYFVKFLQKTPMNEKDSDIMKKLMDNWDDIIDFQNRMSDRVDEIKKEEQPKSLFDVGVRLAKRMKRGGGD